MSAPNSCGAAEITFARKFSISTPAGAFLPSKTSLRGRDAAVPCNGYPLSLQSESTSVKIPNAQNDRLRRQAVEKERGCARASIWQPPALTSRSRDSASGAMTSCSRITLTARPLIPYGNLQFFARLPCAHALIRISRGRLSLSLLVFCDRAKTYITFASTVNHLGGVECYRRLARCVFWEASFWTPDDCVFCSR